MDMGGDVIIFNWFYCWLFNHDFRVAQELTDYSRRLYCGRCRKSFAMSDDVEVVVPWDLEFQLLYQSHGVYLIYLPEELRGKG